MLVKLKAVGCREQVEAHQRHQAELGFLADSDAADADNVVALTLAFGLFGLDGWSEEDWRKKKIMLKKSSNK